MTSRVRMMGILLAGLCLAAAVSGAPALPGQDAVAKDMAAGQRLAEQFHLTELMGPLAPIALSPYFGIMLLSGLSILSSRGIIPGNGFLVGNTALNNEWVFVVFLVLTVLTSLPKFTKLSKALAQLVDQLEAYSSIIALGVIYYFSHHGAPAPAPEIARAGLFSLTGDGVMLVAMALNIIVINTVKFFFEMLILISPIPLVDAIFEAGNKAVAGALMLIYAFSPWLATALNVCIFLVCLAIFRFAWRRARYYRSILFGLVFKTASPQRTVPYIIRAAVHDQDLALPVFLRQKGLNLKKLQRVYLVHAPAGWSLVALRWLGAPQVYPCAGPFTLSTGLISHTLSTPDGLSFALSRRYDRLLPAWSHLLPPADGGVAASSVRTIFTREHRATLRTEL